jgi:hypothetical protein
MTQNGVNAPNIYSMHTSPKLLPRYFSGKTDVKQEKILENPATALRIEMHISVKQA